MHVDVGQPGHVQRLAEGRHLLIIARWPHHAHQEIEPHQWQPPSMPTPVGDALYRVPGSALEMDVASVGVGGVAGDPAGLPGAGSQGRYRQMPQPFRRAAAYAGKCDQLCQLLALPFY
jgi:hypothetical protein